MSFVIKAHPNERTAPDASRCPICGCVYAGGVLAEGDRCGDLSRGQGEPCHGILVAVDFKARAAGRA